MFHTGVSGCLQPRWLTNTSFHLHPGKVANLTTFKCLQTKKKAPRCLDVIQPLFSGFAVSATVGGWTTLLKYWCNFNRANYLLSIANCKIEKKYRRLRIEDSRTASSVCGFLDVNVVIPKALLQNDKIKIKHEPMKPKTGTENLLFPNITGHWWGNK